MMYVIGMKGALQYYMNLSMKITYDSHKIFLTVKFDHYQVILQLKKNYAYKSESQLSHDLFNLQAHNFYMVLLLGNAFPSLSY